MMNLRHLDTVQRLGLFRRCLHIRPMADSITITNKVTTANIASLFHDCFAWMISVDGTTGRSQYLESLLDIGTFVE